MTGSRFARVSFFMRHRIIGRRVACSGGCGKTRRARAGLDGMILIGFTCNDCITAY